MATFKQAFGFNLKLIRKNKNITQEQLSEMIELHPRQLSKIETGSHFPSCKTIEKLCQALDTPPRVLFDFYYDTEMYMTGTDGCYKAIHSGNVIFLQNVSDKTIEKFTVEDIDYCSVAKKFGTPITINHYENNKLLRTVVYKPDGSFETVKDFSDNEYGENMNFMMEKCRKYAHDREYSNFIKTALLALENPQSLEQLSYLIEGMKLSRKKIAKKTDF